VADIRALHGGEVILPTPNESCIAELRRLLDKAEAGEIVGIVCASLHGDKLGSYTFAGMIGPYSLLGAVDMAHHELRERMGDAFE
jgi:hypothetical protein